MITIPNKKNVFEKRLEVKISHQEIFKFLILKHPMPIPIIHVLFLEFLLPLPIER
jgi:hypothetical protein